MKVILLAGVVSAFSIQQIFSKAAESLNDNVQHVSHAVNQVSVATHDKFNDWEQLLYQHALTTQSDEVERINFDQGLSISELLEGPHDPHKHKPHRPPHRPPHKNPHDQRDQTLWEFLSNSEYFTILTSIIEGDKHAVDELNKTAANLTLFAPTDKALEKYAEHAPPVEYLRKILLYHILPDLYPASRVLRSKTLKTLYQEEIGPQRLAVDLNFRGLTLNYYARIIYVDVNTSNGIIHAIDNLLFPPPKIYDIAETLPTQFSTFINAAWKTGLVDTLNQTSNATVFAPSNFAFAKLGARLNAYLFSSRGAGLLTKVLKYHIVPDVLFYSDDVITKGLATHFEFENILGEKINVDITEWGRFKTIVFNGRAISVSDIPAKNGVLSKLGNLILPYKRHTGSYADLSVEEFEALYDEEEQITHACQAVEEIYSGL